MSYCILSQVYELLSNLNYAIFCLKKSHKHNNCKKTIVEYVIAWSRYCEKELSPCMYYYRVSSGKSGDQPSAPAHTRDCTEAGRGHSGGKPHGYSGRDQPPASAHSGDCTQAGEDSQEDILKDTQVKTSLQLLRIQEIVQRQGEDSQEDSLKGNPGKDPASSFCLLRRLCRGRGRTASQILR